MIERVEHIGIAVQNLDKALELYTRVLGLELLHREIIESRGVEVAILDGKNTMIELVSDYSGNSTIKKFIERRGEGLHHIAYKVDDIYAELETLQNAGVKLIDDKPRDGAHSSKVAFIHPEDFCGVLIELCQD
jgi:methylmalonyl-CoA/ethylmalonyl-CoA epimerase